MGAKLASRYLLLRPLGSGGMGTVWLARDEILDREVAIKEMRIPKDIGEQERAELLARVMREAEVMARLRHPAIVAVHDVLMEDGRPWIVMERLHGRNLDDELAAHGPQSSVRVARTGVRLLEALTAAHAHDVQHRDVKPGNVFLTNDDRVVLTDFGIARSPDQSTLTGESQVIGTPGFIAPERLSGERGGPASDLWSLGVTLSTALEGVPPYGGSPADAIRATLTQDPPPPRVAGPLASLLRWLMARAPEARPDAETTLRLLRQIADGESPHITAPQTVRRRPRRWTRAVLAAAAATVATVTVVVWTMEKPAPAAKPVSPVFHQAVDLCGVLPAGQVTKLLGAPADGRDADEGGCQWTISGAGLDLSPITDSDTPDPWSLTVESAHTLYLALERQQKSSLREGSWIWYEIGVDNKQATVRSAPRVVADVGDEAFSWNSANVRGQARMSAITFRLGNLVATLTYADLDSDSADALRQGAVEMARSAVAELRSLG
ncbi:serine/threonine-protein kinase [Streptosporangium sp. 'caverna']|uniref:serine/threonine-protein kinase n=1 Tax=Streptosporangium sp. 'caverna' TaxID=2202249 RepID=UPI0013A70B8F|nr:serine/threonine-protein kinase [Streptosporangium sp. 'caverna']